MPLNIFYFSFMLLNQAIKYDYSIRNHLNNFTFKFRLHVLTPYLCLPLMKGYYLVL